MEVKVSMPHYRKMQWQSNRGAILELKLEPRGLFRRLFRSRIPYLTGDIVELNLKTKSVSAQTEYDYKYWVNEILPDGKEETRSESQSSFQIVSNGTMRIPLKSFKVRHSGEYSVMLTCVRKDNRSVGETEELLVFDAPPRDLYRATRSNAWMSGIIGGIIGAIIMLIAIIASNGGFNAAP
jgi:hypothetical protein